MEVVALSVGPAFQNRSPRWVLTMSEAAEEKLVKAEGAVDDVRLSEVSGRSCAERWRRVTRRRAVEGELHKVWQYAT